jgi:hypothetical protein
MTSPTSFIKRKAGASLLHSPRTAQAHGRPLNTFVTINLWQFGITPRNAAEVFQQLRQRHFQTWSRYKPRGSKETRNGPPTYAWVIEAPNRRVHCHWAVHIRPNQLDDFEKKLPKWLLRLTGESYVPSRAIDIIENTRPEGTKLYMAKGLDRSLAAMWNIRPVDSGTIIGRRAGTSRNLGPSEWQPRKEEWRRMRRAAA